MTSSRIELVVAEAGFGRGFDAVRVSKVAKNSRLDRDCRLVLVHRLHYSCNFDVVDFLAHSEDHSADKLDSAAGIDADTPMNAYEEARTLHTDTAVEAAGTVVVLRQAGEFHPMTLLSSLTDFQLVA